MRNVDNCRSCGARIIWARTTANKAMPLDLAPTPTGNVILYQDGTCSVVGAGTVLAPPAYVSHFATCPNAKRHRKAAP